MRKIIPFNPLDKRNLGESIADAMIRLPAVPAGRIEPFEGAGIYAFYYTGDFAAYGPIAECNKHGECRAPIYVGKAVPKGARKGGDLELPAGRVLYNRLVQHVRGIEAATNLSVDDFLVRYLVVDDIWIPLGEALLIARFCPLWNKTVDGFGNHDPGSGRHAGMMPRWDVLHPGRNWAERCTPRAESAEQIIREVDEYLRSNPGSRSADHGAP